MNKDGAGQSAHSGPPLLVGVEPSAGRQLVLGLLPQGSEVHAFEGAYAAGYSIEDNATELKKRKRNKKDGPPTAEADAPSAELMDTGEGILGTAVVSGGNHLTIGEGLLGTTDVSGGNHNMSVISNPVFADNDLTAGPVGQAYREKRV
jgi:hypothetical protein